MCVRERERGRETGRDQFCSEDRALTVSPLRIRFFVRWSVCLRDSETERERKREREREKERERERERQTDRDGDRDR